MSKLCRICSWCSVLRVKTSVVGDLGELEETAGLGTRAPEDTFMFGRSTSAYPPPRRLKDPDEIERYRSKTLAGGFGLTRQEQEWRDRSEFIESHGYCLRPRFRKGWKPSWLEKNLYPYECEDSQKLIVSFCFHFMLSLIPYSRASGLLTRLGFAMASVLY